MEEKEALRTYCRRMISQIKRERCTQPPGQGGRGRTNKHGPPRGEIGKLSKVTYIELSTKLEDRASQNIKESGYQPRNGSTWERGIDLNTNTNAFQRDSAVQSVPFQLISLLKHKSFAEEMRRGASARLHDPSVCGMCVQKQASLALNAFIRRKTTQLDNEMLEDRLHTHICNRDTVCLLGELLQSIPKQSDAPSRIWQQLLAKKRGSPQPAVTLTTVSK